MRAAHYKRLELPLLLSAQWCRRLLECGGRIFFGGVFDKRAGMLFAARKYEDGNVHGRGGGRKEKDTDQKMEDVLSSRKLLNEVRTFFQQKIHRDNYISTYYRYLSATTPPVGMRRPSILTGDGQKT